MNCGWWLPGVPGIPVTVGSGRGALPGLLPVGFPDLPAKPGVRVAAHRAFHVSWPLCYDAGWGVQGPGIRVPR